MPTLVAGVGWLCLFRARDPVKNKLNMKSARIAQKTAHGRSDEPCYAPRTHYLSQAIPSPNLVRPKTNHSPPLLRIVKGVTGSSRFSPTQRTTLSAAVAITRSKLPDLDVLRRACGALNYVWCLEKCLGSGGSRVLFHFQSA